MLTELDSDLQREIACKLHLRDCIMLRRTCSCCRVAVHSTLREEYAARVALIVRCLRRWVCAKCVATPSSIRRWCHTINHEWEDMRPSTEFRPLSAQYMQRMLRDLWEEDWWRVLRLPRWTQLLLVTTIVEHLVNTDLDDRLPSRKALLTKYAHTFHEAHLTKSIAYEAALKRLYEVLLSNITRCGIRRCHPQGDMHWHSQRCSCCLARDRAGLPQLGTCPCAA